MVNEAVVSGTASVVPSLADSSIEVGLSPQAMLSGVVGQGPGTALNDEFSVEFWFDDPFGWGGVFLKTVESGSSSGWNMGYNNDNERLVFDMRLGSTGSTLASVSSPVTLASPNHVVITKDSAQLRMFLNGVEVDANPTGGEQTFFSPTDDRLVLGQFIGQPVRFDELAFYDRAITPVEVADHHELGLTGAAQPQTTVQYADTANLLFATAADTEADIAAGNLRLEVRDLSTGSITTLVTGLDIRVLDATPDGTEILVDIGGDLALVANPGGTTTSIASGVVRPINARLSDDGTTVTVGTAEALDPGDADTDIDWYVIEVGAAPALLPNSENLVTAVPVTNGDEIIVATNTEIAVVTTATGTTSSLATATSPVFALDVSPDSRFVSWVENGTDVVAHDRDSDGDSIFDESGATASMVITDEVANTYAGRVTAPPRISSNGRLTFAKWRFGFERAVMVG
ncbi:MAG: LamG domain-containing protein [Actinomycetia bacterium]|nr:LamG domain-containing protein [Actinomycetes bacterium]